MRMTWEEYFASSKERWDMKSLEHIASKCPNDDVRKLAVAIVSYQNNNQKLAA